MKAASRFGDLKKAGRYIPRNGWGWGMGASPGLIYRGPGVDSQLCKFNYYLVNTEGAGSLIRSRPGLTKLPRLMCKSRKPTHWLPVRLTTGCATRQSGCPANQLCRVDNLHEKPQWSQKCPLCVRGVHYVIRLFSASGLCLPRMDICHLKLNGMIYTRAPVPWTGFRRPKGVSSSYTLILLASL